MYLGKENNNKTLVCCVMSCPFYSAVQNLNFKFSTLKTKSKNTDHYIYVALN